MLRKILTIALIICPLLAVAPASGDPWKDESGKGRYGKKWKWDRGETPWWGRGKGYWDGHFKHGHWGPPEPPPRYYVPSRPFYYYYYAPLPPPEFYYEHSWPDDGFEELPPPVPRH